MTVSTEGIELKSAPRSVRSAVELLSSMRFSISLLTLICIAAIIGTVLKQHEPLTNYVNQFGPFWADVFGLASLYSVYSAWWFLLILAFLVCSTSLCIARNTPKIWVDLKTFKENIREQSLQAFGHKHQAVLLEAPEQAAQRISQMLGSGGWRVRVQQRQNQGVSSWMVAAKTGAANKLGYIAAHSAIVLVCLGGLFDGDLIVRAQMLFSGKSSYSGGGLMADVKPEHRLGPGNPTFRGNLLVAEGAQSSTAVISQSDGVLLQDLPFAIELKKFIVEYYSTGMPKLFASDIIIHDKATGEKTAARVEVNHPAQHSGVEIYQSSFDDGGSSVRLKAFAMQNQAASFEIEGVIGGSAQLSTGQDQLTLEYTGLRVINVENFSSSGQTAIDPRKVDLTEALGQRMGAANKSATKKELRNVGPSVSYKLRDGAGQAREFNNYMLPVDLGDGVAVFLMGVRDSPAEPFRYLRIPADEKSSSDAFFQLKAALADAGLREQAVRRYAQQAVAASRPDLMQQLMASATRALALFAGAESIVGKPSPGGLQALADFVETHVPEGERAKAGEVLIRILNGTLFELAQVARQRAGEKPLEPSMTNQAFMTQAVLALSDALVYPVPMVFQLLDFKQVQASVFQVARAPGKTLVYLGCALLILGIFAMLYVRERRIWVWLTPVDGATQAVMALSTNRKTLDGDSEFVQLAGKLLGSNPAAH